MANDPHLGASIPGIWYQMGLHCRRSTPTAPSTSPASPSPGFRAWSSGTTATIAWGLTNLDPDVTDLYLEKVTGKTYLYDGKQVPLTERDEEIRVAGGRRG